MKLSVSKLDDDYENLSVKLCSSIILLEFFIIVKIAPLPPIQKTMLFLLLYEV